MKTRIVLITIEPIASKELPEHESVEESGIPPHPARPRAAVAYRYRRRADVDWPKALNSATLLQGQITVNIHHNGECYQLRTTRAGKLILTK
ncbi:MAG: hemin uptake protein HemP [Pararobbsia sp.]